VSEPEAVAAPDPASLPLFAGVGSWTSPGTVPRDGAASGLGTVRARASGSRPPRAQADTSVASVAPEVVPPVAARGRGSEAGLDWSLVAAFRAQASNVLTSRLGADRARLSMEAQRELGRSIIVELLQATAAEDLSAGRTTVSVGEQDALARAVFDAVFGLGRLQPLVDDDRIENIIITGAEHVTLELIDGTVTPGPPVADSDAELIDFLVFLASRSEVNARPFSEAQPRLHLRLDGGARLAAAAWVTPRPSVVIRRHRLRAYERAWEPVGSCC